jgi:hypothetical protein
MTHRCAHCRNGYLRMGDIECVNGVMIDIDTAHEGWHRDEDYPPAPCTACSECNGRGDGCVACKETGWTGGINRSQELLEEWAKD